MYEGSTTFLLAASLFSFFAARRLCVQFAMMPILLQTIPCLWDCFTLPLRQLPGAQPGQARGRRVPPGGGRVRCRGEGEVAQGLDSGGLSFVVVACSFGR